MKKAMIMTLITGIVMSMAGTAFAETVQSIGLGQHTHEVTAKYEAGETSGTVISIDIDWNNLDFTYFAGSEPVWDPVTHTYTGEAVEAGWSGNGNITVTNHSNACIVAAPSYSAAQGYDDVVMNFDNVNLHVPSAEGFEGSAWIINEDVTAAAREGTMAVIPSGMLPAETDGKIGTITLTISQMQNANENDATSELLGDFTTVSRGWDEKGYVVEDTASVESGEQYILRSEIDAVNRLVQIAFACNSYFGQEGGPTLTELNYRFALARNAVNTLSLHTKP